MNNKEDEELIFADKLNTYLTPFIIAFTGPFWTYNSRLENSFLKERQDFKNYGYDKKSTDLRIVQSNARNIYRVFQILLIGFIIFLITR